MEKDRKFYRPVTITPVLNGFIVKVGCSQVVFTDEDDFIDAFSKWIKDPQGTERSYQKNAINDGPVPTEAPTLGAEGPRAEQRAANRSRLEEIAPTPANQERAGESRW